MAIRVFSQYNPSQPFLHNLMDNGLPILRDYIRDYIGDYMASLLLGTTILNYRREPYVHCYGPLNMAHIGSLPDIYPRSNGLDDLWEIASLEMHAFSGNSP